MASASRHPRGRNRQVVDSESDEEDHVVRHESEARPQTIDLSDDEDLVPPAPPVRQQMPSTRHPVGEVLRRRGVVPRAGWMDSCMNELAANQPGFAGLSPERQAELCFAQFLMADFNVAGDGCLPPSVHAMHGTELAGPFALQVDEVIDIGQPLRERYQEKPAKPGRVLKLSMTDGVQRVLGIEYRPIKALQVLSPAGMKISVKNVCVKRGLLLLVPEIVEILGGHVERLESARLRTVQFITKPPRGRWVRRNATEPPLTERATAAAWPDNQAEGNAAPPASSNQDEHRPYYSAVPNPQGAMPTVYNHSSSTDHYSREAAQQRAEHRPPAHAQPRAQHGNALHSHRLVREPPPPPMPQNGQLAQPMEVDEQAPGGWGSSNISGVQHARVGIMQPGAHHRDVHSLAQSSGEVAGNRGAQAHRSGNLGHSEQVPQAQQERDGGSLRPSSTYNAREPASTSTTPHAEERNNSTCVSAEVSSSSPAFGRLSLQSRRAKFTSPLAAPQMRADERPSAPDEFEQHAPAMGISTLPRNEALESKNAFTYLAVLKDKIDSKRNPQAVVRGRVKCVILGVISFQYKDCDEFELRVHIEDGSLITPAFVHHQLVQTLIGYPPREVMSRLRAPETHDEMTSNMIRFQKLLQKFEGFMEVEWSKSASGPTAVKWSEGMEYESIRLCLDRFSKVISGNNRTLHTSNRFIPTIDLT